MTERKREKVIKGLQEAVDWLSAETSFTVIEQWVVRDALALLKAQEPVEPIPTLDDDWECGHCGESVVGHTVLNDGGFEPVKHNYCPRCGRAVKWE